MSARRIGFRVTLALGRLLVAAFFILHGHEATAASLEQMQQSAIRIACNAGGKTYRGSGFVVGTDRATYVATNDHVVECADPDASESLVIVLARDQSVPIDIVWRDPDMDLAILRSARPLDRPAVELADTSSVVAGAPITAVGFPGAADSIHPIFATDDVAVPSVTRGNISRVVTSTKGLRFFQHSAATNPGSSGGPIYDEAGNVIGVNSWTALTLAFTKPSLAGAEIVRDRFFIGEGIAGAVDVAQLLPHLKAAGVPFQMASAPVSTVMIVLAGAAALLLGVGGTVVATPSGRSLLLRLATSSNGGATAQARVGKVRVLDGSLAGTEVPITAKLVLGRDPAEAQLVYPQGDTAVSRRHCEIRFDPGLDRFEVRDLGSRNGTFVASGTETPRRLAPNIIEPIAPGHSVFVGSRRNRLVLELGRCR